MTRKMSIRHPAGKDAGNGTTWAIVLAGGEGKRMQGFIRRRFGVPRPKQYCRFAGRGSMLEQTVARAQKVVCPEQIVTIIGRGHRRFLQRRPLSGPVIEQPVARDTGPGILLPAACILAIDPEASLLIFPSDHFIYPEWIFVRYLERARRLADSFDKLVLLAAIPDRPETDYGWIETGPSLEESSRAGNRHAPCAGLRFHEKPVLNDAVTYLSRGLLWNTMVMAVKARTLWSQARLLFPDVIERLERTVRCMIASAGRRSNLVLESSIPRALFEEVPSFNFAQEFLSPMATDCLVLPLRNLFWSDWGRPQRVLESIERISKSRARVEPPSLDSTI